MLGDVEVADAEREVDRVEIFERGGQERQVKREEGERQGGSDARDVGLTAISAALRGERRREQQSFVQAARCGSPADRS